MKIKEKIAIYPGTFDPITNGHLDILSRATKLFDKITIAVVENPSKPTLFSFEERLRLTKESMAEIQVHCPVQVDSFNGLMVNYAREKKAFTVVRGLRAISDFEYEFQMALMNRQLAAEVDSVFLMPDQKYVFLSSSMVKIIARHQGDLNGFLTDSVIDALRNKYSQL